jgi:hypothetical protein
MTPESRYVRDSETYLLVIRTDLTEGGEKMKINGCVNSGWALVSSLSRPTSNLNTGLA